MTALDLILVIVGVWLLLIVACAALFLYAGRQRKSRPLTSREKLSRRDLYPTW